ncbi:MAG: hypothetical protein AAFR66_12250, partial [Bacteroidota bacterium]
MLTPHPKITETLAGKEPTHIRKPEYSFRYKPGLWIGVFFLLCNLSLFGKPIEPDLAPCTGPTIILQPTDSTTSLGGGVAFYASASGVGMISYQWQVKSASAPE